MQNSNVGYIKIHPAIGVARIANNEHYFEFFEANSKAFSPAKDYMSKGGPSDPKDKRDIQRLKRQAVQFRMFAYDNNNNLLGELKDVLPDAQAQWSAAVGNRKLLNYSSKRGGNTIKSVTAQASASAGETAELNGVSPWNSNVTINLGSISGSGLFVPAKGGVTRENPNSTIAAYPANQDRNLETTDTTCDGEISGSIVDASGKKLEIVVIPAWIVSAPPQHCLTLTPARVQDMHDNRERFDPSRNNISTNLDWVKTTKTLLGITGEVHDPTGLDLPMMLTMNGDYNPGMEVNIGDIPRMETGLNPANLFYPRGHDFIGTNEIRVQPKASQPTGTKPGQITSGLCSTWQGDMVACLNYWTAENPNQAYGSTSQGERVETVIYKTSNPNERMSTPKEINEEMDFRGLVEYKPVGRKVRLTLAYDPNRPET